MIKSKIKECSPVGPIKGIRSVGCGAEVAEAIVLASGVQESSVRSRSHYPLNRQRYVLFALIQAYSVLQWYTEDNLSKLQRRISSITGDIIDTLYFQGHCRVFARRTATVYSSQVYRLQESITSLFRLIICVPQDSSLCCGLFGGAGFCC